MTTRTSAPFGRGWSCIGLSGCLPQVRTAGHEGSQLPLWRRINTERQRNKQSTESNNGQGTKAKAGSPRTPNNKGSNAKKRVWPGYYEELTPGCAGSGQSSGGSRYRVQLLRRTGKCCSLFSRSLGVERSAGLDYKIMGRFFSGLAQARSPGHAPVPAEACKMLWPGRRLGLL